MRFKSQPFLGPASRCSAPLCRRASGLCLCGTLPCRHCSAQFRTIQRYADADPFKAFTPLCQSMPLQVRSVLSRTMPLSCLATLCQCQAKLFITHAMLGSSMPLPVAALPSQIRALPEQLHSVHCRAGTYLCFAGASRRAAVPCPVYADLLMTLPKRDVSMHCLCKAALSRYRTRLCNSGAELNATVPLLFSALHCLCESVLYKTYPLPSESLLRLSSAAPVPSISMLCCAGTIPCLAKPLLLNAFPWRHFAMPWQHPHVFRLLP